MKYKYANDEAVSDLIARIVNDIESNSGMYELNVPQQLREVFKTFVSLYTDGAEMYRGVEGLPKTTAQLVNLGVCYIEGNFVYLHKAISDAHKEKLLKRDRLLEKLKRHPANKHLDVD